MLRTFIAIKQKYKRATIGFWLLFLFILIFNTLSISCVAACVVAIFQPCGIVYFSKGIGWYLRLTLLLVIILLVFLVKLKECNYGY